MRDIVAFGDSEFMLGFQLAGIRRTIEATEPEKQVLELLSDSSAGIIITNQALVDKLSQKTKYKLLNSVDPVAVLVSAEASDENLRAMIKKSIGVDLWAKQ